MNPIRFGFLAALAALVAFAATPARGRAEPVGLDPVALEEALYVLIDQTRSARGLPALHRDARIVAAARAHSLDMSDNVGLNHTGTGGTNAGQRLQRAGYASMLWGENLAAWNDDMAALVAAWLASPDHSVNILNRNFVDHGIGIVIDAEEFVWVTHDFAIPRGGGGDGSPAAPSKLTAKPPAGRNPALKLKWKDNSSNENGFKLERKLGSALDTSYATVATLAKNKKTFTDKSGLAAHTTYSYRLTAFNASGVSSPALGSGTTR